MRTTNILTNVVLNWLAIKLWKQYAAKSITYLTPLATGKSKNIYSSKMLEQVPYAATLYKRLLWAVRARVAPEVEAWGEGREIYNKACAWRVTFREKASTKETKAQQLEVRHSLLT